MRIQLLFTVALLACADADVAVEDEGRPRGTDDGAVAATDLGASNIDVGADARAVDATVGVDSGDPDARRGLDPDAEPPPPPPVDCDPIRAHADWTVCGESDDACEAIFEDGAGCVAVCAAVGLHCRSAHENVNGECVPDLQRPPLPCEGVGHESDYCVCGREPGPPVDPPEPAERARCIDEQCLAFPGAEGWGRHAKGGRGGDVYRVTSLADGGAGSLRAGVSGEGPRTIIFDVAGIIDLTSALRVTRSRLTIAGQTAPGGGITLRGDGMDVRADDVILRHLRFRPGDIRKKTQNRDGFTEDALTLAGADIIVDHVSGSWGIDEVVSGGAIVRRITLQWSIVAEGLHRTRLFHGEYDADHDGHSMGSLFKPRDTDGWVTAHHNLYAHNNNRNPAIGGYEAGQRIRADIRNNVVYNCRNMAYVSGETGRVDVNYVGNYAVFGANSNTEYMFRGSETADVRLHARDNYIDTNRNGRIDGRDGGRGVLREPYRTEDAEIEMAPVETERAPVALERVLAESGARPWDRDGTDARIAAQVVSGEGERIDSQREVGGWDVPEAGAPEADGDRDGMPDAWERAHGSDPERPDNNLDADGNGYTNLEDYLQHAARIAR